MPSLAIVGATFTLDCDQIARVVADALAHFDTKVDPIAAIRLGTQNEDGGLFTSDFRASPAIAALLSGSELDGDAIAADLGSAEDRLFWVDGGLMAPLTARYCTRDLLLTTRSTLLLAVRAEPGFCGAAALNLFAARTAAIPVAGVVVAEWPDPPDRILLEEYRFLRENIFSLPVQLPRDVGNIDLGSWPVQHWLAVQPTIAASESSAEGLREVALEPYTAWESRPVGDPRSTARPQIMSDLREIIATEGPMTATRAYSLYNRAAGRKKLTSIARAPLSSAAYWLAREGQVILIPETDNPLQQDDLLRLPDTPPVVVRDLGPRTLEEVPLDEVAELIHRLRATLGVGDQTTLKRAVLDSYGLVRLTARADEYLDRAIELLPEPS